MQGREPRLTPKRAATRRGLPAGTTRWSPHARPPGCAPNRGRWARRWRVCCRSQCRRPPAAPRRRVDL